MADHPNQPGSPILLNLSKPPITKSRTPRQLSSIQVGWLTALFFALFLNSPFLSTLIELRGLEDWKDVAFLISVIINLLALTAILISLLAFPFLVRIWLILLLISGATATYFSGKYGVLFDPTMIQNILETDFHEARELVNLNMALNVLTLGVVPAAVVVMLPVRFGSWPREIGNTIMTLVIAAITICLVTFPFYKDYVFLFRQNRSIRHMVVPMGYLLSGYTVFADRFAPVENTVREPSTPAVLGSSWTRAERKLVFVLVLGETARAANFSLGGYERLTNPKLSKKNVIYYDDIHSCGTTTAVSVPCLFARSPRAAFDSSAEKLRDNALDIMKNAGLSVLWRDNNSGCKGVCDRVESQNMPIDDDDSLCNTGECFDMILLESLQHEIEKHDDGLVIVLHQKGSHGPAYVQRAPDDFQVFLPSCKSSSLQECTRTEIVNSYDNSILYTDHLLASLIDFLEARSESLDTLVIYVSDHGESLGEKGLYLHGLPYAIAPDVQTHVPLIVWFSAGYLDRSGIEMPCVRAHAGDSYSHDNLFHTLLGAADVRSEVYQAAADIFSPCRRAG